MIQELIVVCALALTAKAQSVALDTDTALYILCGILGVSALVCLLLVICIAVFCCKLYQLRLISNREHGELSDTGKVKERTSNTHSNLSLPMEANPAYEKFTPPGSQGVATTTFASRLSQNSLSDLNLDHFHPSMLTTRDEKEESPTTPTTPQGFVHTPLLSRQGDAGNPCSIPEIQVEDEQKTFNSITSSPWRDEPNITLTSISPRSRPRSQEHHHLSGVNPAHPHSNTLQPVPVLQGHLKGIGQAQPSPRTKHAQTYLDSLTASVTPKSKRRYSPSLARKMDASNMKGSVSTPEQLGIKRLHSHPKKTIELDYKEQVEEDLNEVLANFEEALQSFN